MIDVPGSLSLVGESCIPDRFDNHIQRRLSQMAGQYFDHEAYGRMLEDDPLLYEVYELERPKIAGELLHGVSVVHPGKVGDEFFMTKGHFHKVLETAEIYVTLKGRGMMVMETPEGDTSVEPLLEGGVLYVPPRWAHRSVNVDPNEDLVMFFAYPGNAGHDYTTIESQGFCKLVVDVDGEPQVIDNPRWSPTGETP